jgi:hypothetical protein
MSIAQVSQGAAAWADQFGFDGLGNWKISAFAAQKN